MIMNANTVHCGALLYCLILPQRLSVRSDLIWHLHPKPTLRNQQKRVFRSRTKTRTTRLIINCEKNFTLYMTHHPHNQHSTPNIISRYMGLLFIIDGRTVAKFEILLETGDQN